MATLLGASTVYNRMTGRWQHAHPAAAINARCEFIDLGEDELLALYELASEHAAKRVRGYGIIGGHETDAARMVAGRGGDGRGRS